MTAWRPAGRHLAAGVAGGRLRGENRDRGEGVIFRCSNKIEPTSGCYESYKIVRLRQLP